MCGCSPGDGHKPEPKSSMHMDTVRVYYRFINSLRFATIGCSRTMLKAGHVCISSDPVLRGWAGRQASLRGL